MFIILSRFRTRELSDKTRFSTTRPIRIGVPMQSSALQVSPRRGLNKRASTLDLAVDLDIACEVCLKINCTVLTGQTSECPSSWDWTDDTIMGEGYWIELLDEQQRLEEGLSPREHRCLPAGDDPIWDSLDDHSYWRDTSAFHEDPFFDDYPDF